MPNFPGNKPYALYAAGQTPMVDVGTLAKGREISTPRGGTTADYNVKLRGMGVRIDERPPRPYP